MESLNRTEAVFAVRGGAMKNHRRPWRAWWEGIGGSLRSITLRREGEGGGLAAGKGTKEEWGND